MSLAPYYQDLYVTIYQGDCSVIAPQLGEFDLLLTDPPYGIGADKRMGADAGTRHGKAKAAKRGYGPVTNWDAAPPLPWVLDMLRGKCKSQIVWGGNYFSLPPSSCWLVWDKENGENDFADCELAWTNLKSAVRQKRHLWNGMLRKGKEPRMHPTQKPLDVIKWALQVAGDDIETVLDPYAGSGTTGLACKEARLKCVQIEREERYCEIAATRLSQEVLAL